MRDVYLMEARNGERRKQRLGSIQCTKHSTSPKSHHRVVYLIFSIAMAPYCTHKYISLTSAPLSCISDVRCSAEDADVDASCRASE